jgi:hypothetical protein
MKTAMQELIDWTNQYEGQMISADQVVLHAYKLLEKEKEQIIKAVEDTRGNIVPRMFISENLSGEQYYNQTYNQNK